jgi:hypothetical protein
LQKSVVFGNFLQFFVFFFSFKFGNLLTLQRTRFCCYNAADQLASIDAELAAVRKQLRILETRQRTLERQRTEVLERLQQAEADRLQNQNWGRRTGFPWSSRLDAALKEVFRLDNYRKELPVVSGPDVID